MSGIDFVMLIMLEDWMTNDILAKKKQRLSYFSSKALLLRKCKLAL